MGWSKLQDNLQISPKIDKNPFADPKYCSPPQFAESTHGDISHWTCYRMLNEAIDVTWFQQAYRLPYQPYSELPDKFSLQGGSNCQGLTLDFEKRCDE